MYARNAGNNPTRALAANPSYPINNLLHLIKTLGILWGLLPTWTYMQNLMKLSAWSEERFNNLMLATDCEFPICQKLRAAGWKVSYMN